MTGAVEIQGIAAGGDGVARLPEGLAVFVPRAAPNDVVELEPITRRRRFARARITRLIRSSPDRVDPRCIHYERDRCGGCQLQHLSIEAQVRAKSRIVGDALRRIGRLDAADPPVEPAVNVWDYRAKITLSGDSSGRRIGYHQLDRPDRIFELERCEIADPALRSLWDAVRAERRLLPPVVDQIVLRLDRGGGRHLVVTGRREEAWTTAGQLAARLADRGVPATLWWQPPRGRARVLAGQRTSIEVAVFQQVNPVMGDRVRQFAVEAVGPVSDSLVWDLYAGVGETTDLLLARGARVESIEIDARAVQVASSNGGTPDRVRRLAGAVEERIGELGPPEAVVTNPPRTGMAATVVDAIGRAGARRVVYVSCDPATLARDLGRLRSVYPVDLADCRAFDLFPQTAHVETVAVLERA